MKSNLFSYMLIAIAGFFWATLGIFTNVLTSTGLTSPQISFLRLLLGAIFLTLYCLIKDPKALRITKKGLLVCILLGLFCQAFFNICYVNSISNIGVSVSAVLLYTSPIFMAILSKVCYREKINGYKIFSLALCFVGAFLAATGGVLTPGTLNVTGILLGLCAAVSYSSMPFISKSAMSENKNVTVVLYSFLFGAIFLLPFAKPTELLQHITSWNVIVNILGLGLFPACLAFLFFYSGISRRIEFSIVGILSSTELIFAQIFGWTLFHESFSFLRLVGIIIMFTSAFVVLYEVKSKERNTMA